MSVFRYSRRVAFADTDSMGVCHHANYLRFVEEARVAWMRETGLTETHYPKTSDVLAVLSYQVWHLKPCRFEDLIEVHLQVRRKGVRVEFNYKMHLDGVLIAEAVTKHVCVDKELRPARPHPLFIAQLEKEKWTETWLLNS